LYLCRRYWIVRELSPRISAAREVEPPVDFKVSTIANSPAQLASLVL
jgi:hypothetical protein